MDLLLECAFEPLPGLVDSITVKCLKETEEDDLALTGYEWARILQTKARRSTTVAGTHSQGHFPD